MDVLAAQEVLTGRRNRDALGHQNFWKLWSGGWAALYIYKRWKKTDWKEIKVAKHAVAATVGGVRVYSIYSEGHSSAWCAPIVQLVREALARPTGLLDDFNLHHPLWVTEDRASRGGDKLLDFATHWSLLLATPRG